jgi:hypothetical protein
MKKLVALGSILAMLSSTPAMALGDVERGALYGIAGLWTFQQLSRIGQGPYYGPPPMTSYPTPAAPIGGWTHRPMYRAVDVFIPECNCYRTIMVQIN